MIRVLIVDDSATVRALLRFILESDPEIQVIGMAPTGVEGVRQTLALKPDLITMDVYMPGLDGFEATRQIMEQRPTPIVIVSSGVEHSEMMVTFNAMQAGALEVIGKPAGVMHPNYPELSQQLITTVKLMSEVKVIRRYRSVMSPRPVVRSVPAERPLTLLAIGASTGGPAALNLLRKGLPVEFPLPVLVVQHMTVGFMGGLVSWLQLESRLQIKIGEDGERVRPGKVYFAPDDTHIQMIGHGILGLSQGAPVNHVRPSANVLFDSVARVYGGEAVGILLTGMGEDGASGLKAMHDRGSPTIAQDEATSAVYGMPKAAMELGAADQILPIGQIPGALLALLSSANKSG
jgi:two-component system chemotaxis response regulator CheB